MGLTSPLGQPGPLKDGEFVGGSVANVVTFAHTNLQPPSVLYIQRDDVLSITSTTSFATETLNINARLLLPDGSISTINQVFTFPGSSAASTLTISLAEGFLLSVGVSSASAVTRGITFVRVNLVRAGVGVANAVDCLVADYVTQRQTTGWPIGRIVGSTEGSGAIKTVQVAGPGGGNDWTVALPAQRRWRIQSISAAFNTSAQVANRSIHLKLTDSALPGSIVWQTDDLPVITATTPEQIEVFPGAPLTATLSPTMSAPLPFTQILGQSGSTTSIASVTNNIQSGDAWNNIFINVEEWIDV